MPIYEYYCTVCLGYFRQLARSIDTKAPACPRCGNPDVKRMVTTVNTIHSSTYHQEHLKQQTGSVNTENSAEIAQFLKESGRLEDAEGVYGSKAFRELVNRRIEGAVERDLTDLVDELASEMQKSTGGDISGAVLFSDEMENRMAAEGLPGDHDNRHEQKPNNRNQKASTPVNHGSDDLGWV